MSAWQSRKGQRDIQSPPRRARLLGLTATVAAWTGRVSLLGAVLCAPWFLGAVQAWVQVLLISAVLVSLLSTTVYLLLAPKREGPPRAPLAMIPLLLAIGLGVGHLVPLDRATLGRVSPRRLSVVEEFLPAANSAGQENPNESTATSSSDQWTVSVCPAVTRQSLAHLILAASVFFLAAILFARPATHLWLLGLIAVNGGAIGFFGLAQNLTWNGQIYWSIILTQGGGPFGPFVNHNNAGGYLVLCLAAALGLALWCLGRYFKAWDSASHRRNGHPEGIAIRAQQAVMSALADLNASTLTWLTIAGLLVAAICCTLSRGSVLAMLSAVLVTTMIMAAYQRRGWMVLWPLTTLVLGLFLIGWLGLSDELGAQLATLFQDDTAQQARILHWQDGLKAAADYPISGSGLGTYRFVYAQYQQRLAEWWFHYAENVYLQVLVETGIAGLVLLLAGFAFVGAAVRRLLARSSDLATLAFAVTGIFALAGQMVASLFDFGLFIPANFLLFALICGALVGNAGCFRKPHRNDIGAWETFSHRGVALLVTSLLLAGCFWGRKEIQLVVPVEKAMREVRLAGDLADLSSDQLTSHIQRLTDAGRSRPDDVELQRKLAELWIQRYESETIKELLSRTSFTSDDPRLTQMASPLLVHQRAWLFVRSNSLDQLEALRQSPTVRENLIPALEHLIASRRACPLLPEVHCAIAQLCAISAPVSEDRIHIERTRKLAPGNPDLLYITGLLDFQASRFTSAYASWKASLTLTPRYLTPVLQIAGTALVNEEVVAGLLPDDPNLLVRLARQQFSTEADKPIRERLLTRTETLLTASTLPEAERVFLRGSIQAMRGSFPEAIASYEKALTLRSYEVEWRYELARLLKQQGFLEEAREQARRCVRLEPQEKKHTELLEEILALQFPKASSIHGS